MCFQHSLCYLYPSPLPSRGKQCPVADARSLSTKGIRGENVPFPSPRTGEFTRLSGSSPLSGGKALCNSLLVFYSSTTGCVSSRPSHTSRGPHRARAVCDAHAVGALFLFHPAEINGNPLGSKTRFEERSRGITHRFRYLSFTPARRTRSQRMVNSRCCSFSISTAGEVEGGCDLSK